MSQNPLLMVPADPSGHFKLYFYGAILRIFDRLLEVVESQEAAFERFPFLAGYVSELAQTGLEGLTTAEALPWWRDRISDWESRADGFLPIRALQRAAGLSFETLIAYFCLGLSEEDPRFGVLVAALQGTPGQHHLTYGLLDAWIAGVGGASDAAAEPPARGVLRQLQAASLVRVTNPDAPRFDWALKPTPLLWDVISGRGAGDLAARRGNRAARVAHHPIETLRRLDELILADELAETVQRLPALLATRQVDTVVVRGPQHNGRRTLLGAIAAELGRGLLDVAGSPTGRDGSQAPPPEGAPDEPSRLVGPLATLLGALPVITCELGPGETAELPRLTAYDGPVGVVMGRQGGLRATGPLLTLSVEMPSPAQRRAHWCRALHETTAGAEAAGAVPGGQVTFDEAGIDTLADRFRLSSGAIYRTADLARAWSALRSPQAGEASVPPPGGPAAVTINIDDVWHASRAINRQALDVLAQHVVADGDWSDLATRAETIDELRLLESRCRHRERLAIAAAPGFAARTGGGAAGVRSLFTGPSGTGKTLAARILASVLKMDLYRVDLSSVVNKYIGETEKNLNELFTRAEELDVMLLIDEGDALLTQRTNVQSSNDRYANLETNFLLQRLESYGGVVVITTNAGERIDGAFQRRMDVLVEFRAPEPAERWAIWQLHMPADHLVDYGLLGEVASRCALTGGQIRNTMLHATVLALEDGGRVTSEHLETAVRREYRKVGGVYPLGVRYG